MRFLIATGLAQSVAGSIPGAGPIFRVLKQLRNEGTSFALQAAQDRCVVRMTRKMAVGEVKILSPISAFVLNTLTLK